MLISSLCCSIIVVKFVPAILCLFILVFLLNATYLIEPMSENNTQPFPTSLFYFTKQTKFEVLGLTSPPAVYKFLKSNPCLYLMLIFLLTRMLINRVFKICSQATKASLLTQNKLAIAFLMPEKKFFAFKFKFFVRCCSRLLL